MKDEKRCLSTHACIKFRTAFFYFKANSRFFLAVLTDNLIFWVIIIATQPFNANSSWLV